jgi:putative hydrolase of the HAD superfamily
MSALPPDWPKGIFVDLDNTLHDYTRAAAAARDQLARYIERAYGVQQEVVAARYDVVREEIDAALFRTGFDCRKRRFRELLASWPETKAVDHVEVANEFGRLLLREITPVPGALELIGGWQEQGVEVLIVTEGFADIQSAIVNSLGLTFLNHKPLITSANHVKKRDGSAYLLGLSMVNLPPEEVVMIGDNWDWDIVAAGGCGIWQLWISSARELRGQPNARFLGRVASVVDASVAIRRQALESAGDHQS